MMREMGDIKKDTNVTWTDEKNTIIWNKCIEWD